jgi:TolA-binding protein
VTTKPHRMGRPAPVRSGKLLLTAVTATVGALLAGCGSGPAQAPSAVIVGNTSVSLNTVQQRVDQVLAKEPAAQQLQQQHKLDQVSRQVVQMAVWHELARQGAAREGIAVDEQQVSQLVDQAGGAEQASKGTIYDATTFRDRARDQLIMMDVGRKYVNRLSVTFDITQVGSRQAALDKARQLAAHPDDTGELLRADQAAGVPAATNQKLTAASAPPYALPLFGVRPGTVVAFSPQGDNSQWIVALVRDRHIDPATPANDGSATPQDQQQDPQQLAQVGLRVLAPLADQLGVKVNPRYGVWDPVGMEVAPSAEEATGFEVGPQGSTA